MSKQNKTEVKFTDFFYCFVLFCILLVLKLVQATDLSWWWVTFPIWGYIALMLLTAGIVAASKKVRKPASTVTEEELSQALFDAMNKRKR